MQDMKKEELHSSDSLDSTKAYFKSKKIKLKLSKYMCLC